jgi:phytanoyl-CoA hydroxylase
MALASAAPVLTPAQHAAYARDGFLVLPGFVSVDACRALRERAAALVAAFEPSDELTIFSTNERRQINRYFFDSAEAVHFFFEEGAVDAAGRLTLPKERAINKMGHNMHDRDEAFDFFSRQSQIERLAHEVGIEDPLLMQSMYIFKQPRVGGEVTCHQDATFLYTEPQNMLGLWFALEDATAENGCLWALPGGHRGGLRSRFVRTGPESTEVRCYDATPWPDTGLVPLEVEAGSVVLLHGLAPHMSHANRSDRSRHAYTLHITDAASAYPQDNWLQRPHFPASGLERRGGGASPRPQRMPA